MVIVKITGLRSNKQQKSNKQNSEEDLR
jgi:hypothetical protein